MYDVIRANLIGQLSYKLINACMVTDVQVPLSRDPYMHSSLYVMFEE